MISKVVSPALVRQAVLQARTPAVNQVRTWFPRSQTRIYAKPLRQFSTAEKVFWAAFFCTTMLSVPVYVIKTYGSTSGE